MKQSRDGPYTELGRAAFENAVALLEDSRILFKNGRYQRAYVLAVLAMEELAKFVLCKAYVTGYVTDQSLRSFGGFERVIRSHFPKQVTFLFTRALKTSGITLLFLGISWNLTMKARAAGAREAGVFDIVERTKQDALYVDLREGKVIVPENQVGEKKTYELMKEVEEAIPFYEKLLSANESEFGSLLGLLKPDK